MCQWESEQIKLSKQSLVKIKNIRIKQNREICVSDKEEYA